MQVMESGSGYPNTKQAGRQTFNQEKGKLSLCPIKPCCGLTRSKAVIFSLSEQGLKYSQLEARNLTGVFYLVALAAAAVLVDLIL
jgi:hypothetical protein